MKGEMDVSCALIWFSSFQLGFILVLLGFFLLGLGVFLGVQRNLTLLFVVCFLHQFYPLGISCCYDYYYSHSLSMDLSSKRQVNAITQLFRSSGACEVTEAVDGAQSTKILSAFGIFTFLLLSKVY